MRMNYRAILKKAADAAGITLLDWHDNWADFGPGYRYIDEEGMPQCWNPINDDGDAMRLAVTLSMRVVVDIKATFAQSTALNATPWTIMHSGDPRGATRYAIVRAAAEIGKAMP
jgi:hypothetical protein